MKTIEVWAPVFAEPAVSMETTIPKKTKPAQVGLQGMTEGGAIDLEEYETPSLAWPGMKNFINQFNLRPHTVSMTDLSDNLKEVLTNFQQVVNDVPKPASGYFVDEIEINLGVNGSGGIVLIGKMEVSMDAAIKVKIKRENKLAPA